MKEFIPSQERTNVYSETWRTSNRKQGAVVRLKTICPYCLRINRFNKIEKYEETK